jgi:hypothetical protein
MEVTVENAKFANQILGTDVYPFEILHMISPTELEIREIYTSSYGQNMSEQKWRFSRDENNPLVIIKLNKDGKWKDSGNITYSLDVKPRRYYDFSF